MGLKTPRYPMPGSPEPWLLTHFYVTSWLHNKFRLESSILTLVLGPTSARGDWFIALFFFSIPVISPALTHRDSNTLGAALHRIKLISENQDCCVKLQIRPWARVMRTGDFNWADIWKLKVEESGEEGGRNSKGAVWQPGKVRDESPDQGRKPSHK